MTWWELKDWKRIERLSKNGISLPLMSKKTKIPYQTVYNWIKRGERPYSYEHPRTSPVLQQRPIYPERLTFEEKAYLLGVLYGDGCSYSGFELNVKDKDFANEVARILSKLVGKKIIPKYYEYPHQLEKYTYIEKTYRVGSKQKKLKEWLCLQKIDFITKKEIVWFYSGFFDSEGYIVKKSQKDTYHMIVTQTGTNLLIKIKKLLNKIGITSSLYLTKKKKNHYALAICIRRYINLIIREGNISIKRKLTKFENETISSYP